MLQIAIGNSSGTYFCEAIRRQTQRARWTSGYRRTTAGLAPICCWRHSFTLIPYLVLLLEHLHSRLLFSCRIL